MVRYSSPLSTSSQTFKSIRAHTNAAAKKQRLAKDAADWMPPVYQADILPLPAFSLAVASPAPVTFPVFTDQNLYNRPPPSPTTLS
jgi:hypothetical protein